MRNKSLATTPREKIRPEMGAIELSLRRDTLTIVGTDEVGRGCLAGPVYAGATILDYAALEKLPPEIRQLIRDSKTLSHGQRQAILPVIQKIALTYAVDHSTVEEIETLGIAPASQLAMRRAIAKLTIPFDILLIDGNQPLRDFPGQQRSIIKGDQLCYAIAAASILAKEARDAFMANQAKLFPKYGFERHVGYGTQAHREIIAKHGICPLHRKTFALPTS